MDQTKKGEFSLFLGVLLHEFFTVLITFSQFSAITHELLASILCCWRLC
jgi:hypothetical protein